MFCNQCGKELKEDSSFCPECGTKIIKEEVEQKRIVESGKKKGRGCFWGIAIVLIAIGGFLFLSRKTPMDIVKGGYLGSYNSITIEELLETDKWSEEERTIDGNQVKCVVAEMKTGARLVFWSQDKWDSFEVYQMETPDGDITDKNSMGFMVDLLYFKFSQDHPEKGIKVDSERLNGWSLFASMVENNSYKGKVGEIAEVENGYMYDMEMQDYLDSIIYEDTMSKLGLEQEKYEGGTSYEYSDEKNVLELSFVDKDGFSVWGEANYTEDSFVEVSLDISGIRQEAPSYMGIRLGDNIDKVVEVLKEYDDLKLLSDEEEELASWDVRKVVYSCGIDQIIEFWCSLDTGAVYDMTYITRISAVSLASEGYCFTGEDKLILPVKGYKAEMELEKSDEPEQEEAPKKEVEETGNIDTSLFEECIHDYGYMGYESEMYIYFTGISGDQLEFYIADELGVVNWYTATITNENTALYEKGDHVILFEFIDQYSFSVTGEVDGYPLSGPYSAMIG